MELNLHKIDFDFLVQQKGMNGCIETREGKCLNRTVADKNELLLSINIILYYFSVFL